MLKIINEGNGINLNNKMVSNEKMQKYQRKMLDRIWTLIYVTYLILKYAMKLSNHIFFTRFYNVHQCFALYDTIMKYLQSFTSAEFNRYNMYMYQVRWLPAAELDWCRV